MKKLGWVVLKAFIGPFILNFMIWMVILDMQFVWLYVDDFMGKGLEWYIILELLFYASATWVPVALPLSILLASIMAFGNLGEHNELTAMKASGLSLTRIMKPLIILMVFVCAGAFFFSNNLWPLAKFKMQVLITDIQNTKGAIILKEGIFYNEMENFSIRVGKKSENGQELYDLVIYDYSGTLKPNKITTDPRDYKRIIRAQQGNISQSKDKKKLLLDLVDGYIVQEMDPTTVSNSEMPFMRYYFEKASLSFKLTSMEFSKSEGDVYENPEYLLSLSQIQQLKDSTDRETEKRIKRTTTFISNTLTLLRTKKDSSKKAEAFTPSVNYFESLSKPNQKRNIHAAITSVKNTIRTLEMDKRRAQHAKQYLSTLDIEWHRKYTLAYACMMLLFLGAPLGAIVKKGGLGWPVIIAILLFLIYFILARAGDEMAMAEEINVTLGMWLSAIVLSPIAIFIFYKANNDSKLFDMEFYQKLFKFNFGKKK